MKHRPTIADKLFRTVCLGFSALLLLLSLICNISIMWTQAHIEELQSNIIEAQRENEVLNVRCENRISLGQLEKIATEELGMHRPGATQLIFIDMG